MKHHIGKAELRLYQHGFTKLMKLNVIVFEDIFINY